MFGYLRPEREELKVREYELYRSVYCGLCKSLGKDYGIISRLTLSYDCTMLAMLTASLKGECSHVSDGRCRVNPLKKCLMCDIEGEAMHLAGAVSVIMTYYKLSDTIADSGFLKRTGARIIRALFKGCLKKAGKSYPEIESDVREMVQAQQIAEENDSGIDASADPTAKLLSKLCRRLSDDEMTQLVLERFGYYLGRWIYIIDAADDLEKDIKHHSFNPFIKEQRKTPEETYLFCNETLNMTAAQLIMAYELLELGSYKEILDNVVYHGLSFQQRECLFEKKSEKKDRKMKKQRHKDYYTFLSGGTDRR